MSEVVMHTAEPQFAKEATEIMAKIIDSTYDKSYLEQVVANEVQPEVDDRIDLPSLLNELEYFFDETIGEWGTHTLELELNTNSKPVNSK